MKATTYDAVISHSRQTPLRNRFRYRTRTWLVDLDELPTLPSGLRWLARFDAGDHIGSSTTRIRDNIGELLAAHGLGLDGGRVLMLANARALGHVFNPLSLHWCYDRSGVLQAVVAEVHNTYGDRHAYVLRPGPDGRVDERIEKQMYVSPFNRVDGHYRIVVSDPGARVSVSVTLERDGMPPFVASLRGSRRPSTGLVAAGLATAVTSLWVSALIRWQGVRLYLRGLRVEPRPARIAREASS
ncbi:MAG TPA: DUF1365 domain-containing protein [Mycobacteriales bacterium]|nr:DUF1365 domain-containing protein [Mycobacteriales bacterium]